ncbi:MAG: hypothetical protein FJZ59_05440 [Chlamydiae bacterium]|nr:hypothetical protein [Chlamydiota bacterium]
MEFSSPIRARPHELKPLLEKKELVKPLNRKVISWLNNHETIITALLIISSICLLASLTYLFITPVALIPQIPFIATYMTSAFVCASSFSAFLFMDKPYSKTSPESFNAKIDFEGLQVDFA